MTSDCVGAVRGVGSLLVSGDLRRLLLGDPDVTAIAHFIMSVADDLDHVADGDGGEDRAFTHALELAHEDQGGNGCKGDQGPVEEELDAAEGQTAAHGDGGDQSLRWQVGQAGLDLDVDAEGNDHGTDQGPDPLQQVVVRFHPGGQGHAEVHEHAEEEHHGKLDQLNQRELLAQYGDLDEQDHQAEQDGPDAHAQGCGGGERRGEGCDRCRAELGVHRDGDTDRHDEDAEQEGDQPAELDPVVHRAITAAVWSSKGYKRY